VAVATMLAVELPESLHDNMKVDWGGLDELAGAGTDRPAAVH